MIHFVATIQLNLTTIKKQVKTLCKVSKQIEDYLSKGLEKDLSKIFDQFLRDKRIPVLEYKLEKIKIK